MYNINFFQIPEKIIFTSIESIIALSKINHLPHQFIRITGHLVQIPLMREYIFPNYILGNYTISLLNYFQSKLTRSG